MFYVGNRCRELGDMDSTRVLLRQLNRIACSFREAIERIDLSDAPGALPDFPEGCCTWATLFLGNYLKLECRYKPKRILSATRGGGINHEWIILDKINIDIVADQFSDSPSAVIVSENSTWHKQWKGGKIAEIHPVSKYEAVALRGQTKPSKLYEMIVSEVRKIILIDSE